MYELNLENLTINELIEKRNAVCMHNGWGSSRARFHVKLRNAFLKFGHEIKDFDWYSYVTLLDGSLVICKKPRYRIKANNIDGSVFSASNTCLVNLNKIDIPSILSPKLIFLEDDRTVSLSIDDTNRRIQFVSFDINHEVIGNAAVIGHLSQSFTQHVYGRNILIIPFDGRQQKRIALGQVIKLKRVENKENQSSHTRYL